MLDSSLGMLHPTALLHQCTGTSIYGLRVRYKVRSYSLGSVYSSSPLAGSPSANRGGQSFVWCMDIRRSKGESPSIITVILVIIRLASRCVLFVVIPAHLASGKLRNALCGWLETDIGHLSCVQGTREHQREPLVPSYPAPETKLCGSCSGSITDQHEYLPTTRAPLGASTRQVAAPPPQARPGR